MDKQTAIDLLDNLLGMVEDNHESDYDTAIKMGIDALKSNAPNALSALDCVERQAARDALNQLSRDNFSLGDWFQTYLTALIAADDAIQSLPSVQPQRMRGKWVKEDIVLTSNPPQYLWHCSSCMAVVHGRTAAILTDFCPNCGADMRETK